MKASHEPPGARALRQGRARLLLPLLLAFSMKDMSEQLSGSTQGGVISKRGTDWHRSEIAAARRKQGRGCIEYPRIDWVPNNRATPLDFLRAYLLKRTRPRKSLPARRRAKVNE